MRPLEAINLIRNLLEVDAQLIDVGHTGRSMAIDDRGMRFMAEVNIDQLAAPPRDHVNAKRSGDAEAVQAINDADV